MPEHFSFDGDQDLVRAQLEDFIATAPEVYIAHADELWTCTAEQRGGVIWLRPAKPIPLEDVDTVHLCCPHATGLYRFELEVLEAEDDLIIATRSTREPLGKRVALRGKAAVQVTLKAADAGGGEAAKGQTSDLSRGGMLLECEQRLTIESQWICRLHLWEDDAVEVRGKVVRLVPAGDDYPSSYGIQFVDPAVDVQRILVDYVLTHADLSAEGGPTRAEQ